MKSLLTKLSYALCIAFIYSSHAYQAGAAFNAGSAPGRSGELAELSQSSDTDGPGLLPQLDVSTPAPILRMNNGGSRSIRFTFTETGNGSGLITSVTYRFYTQYDEPLGEARGPYPARIEIHPLQEIGWKGLVSLPGQVVTAAREMDDYAIVLKTEFNGETPLGKGFRAASSVLLLLSPETFNKISPANGSVDLPTTLPLQWDSSVGAADYEYCLDTVQNTLCETGWKGTYDTQVTLKELPPATTFYWHVRANNLGGKTASDGGAWWSFTTGGTCLGTVTVKNTNDSGPGSLRQATDEVCPGGTILFDPSLSGRTIFLSSRLILQKDLKIDGSALGSKLSISGSHRLTPIDIRPQREVQLAGLVIKDGTSTTNGGGIYNSGALRVTGCRFENNTADNLGGAIFNTNSLTSEYTGTLNASNSTFVNNSAWQGGGIFNSDGPMEIIKSTFVGNSSASGGGIFNWNAPLHVANSTFFKNMATSSGGGIYNDHHTLTLVNNTLSENYALRGGAVYNAGLLSFSNNILANSPSGADCYTEYRDSIDTNQRNLIETSAPWPNHCGLPDFAAEPKLGALASNGGFTQTLALLAGSPAIDAGNNASCEGRDQRGARRPVDGDRNGVAICDIGAYEYRPPSTLKSMAAQDGWLLESGETTKKGALFDPAAATLLLGDNAQKKQYRSILSFNTKDLPDKAVITRVTLKVRRQSVVGGGNPVTLFQGFLVDVKKGFFGASAGLQRSDFQARGSQSYGPLRPVLANGWYAINLTPASAYINRLATSDGVTQLRLRFKLDDNNDAVANALKLYSGNAPVSSRPVLIIEYYVP